MDEPLHRIEGDAMARMGGTEKGWFPQFLRPFSYHYLSIVAHLDRELPQATQVFHDKPKDKKILSLPKFGCSSRRRRISLMTTDGHDRVRTIGGRRYFGLSASSLPSPLASTSTQPLGQFLTKPTSPSRSATCLAP